MSTQFKLDAKATENIIRKRAIIRQSDVDQTRRFHIRGIGNIIPVKNKDGEQVMSASDNTPLNKYIYNIDANSHVAMLNPRNREILKEAMKAEADGNEELAHSKFNEYLNKIQVSFSMIINPGRKITVFGDKQLVEGEIELITTDNGQLLTVSNVRAVNVEKLSKTPEFSLADLMGLDDAVPTAETVFTPVEGATAPVVTE